jgi:hypothetical protein
VTGKSNLIEITKCYHVEVVAERVRHSTTMSASWTLSPEAYALPILHAAKHPSASVNGLFIGSSSSKSIARAIPLHHLPQSLQYSFAPELSFELVAKHVESLEGGLEIVGYYQANERLDDDNLGQRGEKILAALKAGAGAEAAKSIFALVVSPPFKYCN